MRSDPGQVDTDGDGIVDGKDANPLVADPARASWIHADHLGSPAAITDEDGVLQRTIYYGVWGGVRAESRPGGLAAPRPGEGFTGQRRDVETGLLYYGARYYDPELGRFLQPDPIVPDAFDPQSLNRYAYVGNDPLTRVDPSGLSASEPEWEDPSPGAEAEYCLYHGYCGGTSWVPGNPFIDPQTEYALGVHAYVWSVHYFIYSVLNQMIADIQRAKASAPAQLPPLPEEGLRGVSQNAPSSQSEAPTIGGDNIAGVAFDELIVEAGRRQAIQRIANAERVAGRELSTEERLEIVESFDSDLADAVKGLEARGARLQREVEAINNRGFFGKLRGISRLWQISRELPAIERGINVNLLRRRGVGIAREQVLGRIRRYPGDPI